MTTRARWFRSPTAVPAMVLGLTLLLVLGLAGCSGDDGDGGEEGGAEPTGASGSPSELETPDTTSPPDLPVPPDLKRADGAVADVEWDAASCATEAGEQAVGGTVTNPTRDRADYVITVSWINPTSDVLGLGFATVRDARPDEETDWDLTADVGEGAAQCVINVRRGDLARQTAG